MWTSLNILLLFRFSLFAAAISITLLPHGRWNSCVLISEVIVDAAIVLCAFLKRPVSKWTWRIAMTGLLFGDILYFLNHNVHDAPKWVFPVGELAFTVYVVCIAVYLVNTFVHNILPEKKEIGVLLLLFGLFAFLSGRYVLFPFFQSGNYATMFFYVNSTLFRLIESCVLALALIISLKARSRHWFCVSQGIILLSISSIALGYNDGVLLGTEVPFHEYGWFWGLMMLLLAQTYPVQANRGVFMARWDGIRVRLVWIIFLFNVTLLFLLCTLRVFSLQNAFQLTSLLFVVYGLWFVSNLIALKISTNIQNVIDNIHDDPNILITYRKRLHIYEIEQFANKLYAAYNTIKAQSTMIAIGQTTAMLAHDVRKPFTMTKSVLSMLDVLKNSPSELNRAKADIEKAIRHVETMISDVMDFSREVKLETKPKNIVNILDFSVRQLAQGYKDVDISFKYDIQNTFKPLTDDERLSRVFSNIVGNAIDAIAVVGKKKSGTVSISSRDIRQNNAPFVELIIGNDGPPINKEDVPKLFESFFTKGKQKGTGLGLASVKKIIDLHGGEVSARNMGNDAGVEFIIRIPASPEKDVSDKSILPLNIKEILFVELKQDESVIDSAIKELIERGETIKVLLLEDEPLYRASVRNTIKKTEGLHNILVFYEAKYVDDALELVKKENITHAIVDIDLGETKNGFDFLKEAKEKFPTLYSMVHSNRHIKEAKEKAKILGVKAFVPKPLNIEHLVSFLAGESIEQKPKESTTKNSRKVILACDDDAIARKYAEVTLKKAAKEAEIYIFSGGEALLEKLKELEHGDPDKSVTYTVYTDQNMGSMSGLELTEEIKKLGIPCKIFMVANEPKSTFEDKALKAGADGYFEGPISEEIIRKTLQ